MDIAPVANHATRDTHHVSRQSALLALGGLSALIYWVGLILPYNLWALRL
ncbi:MAG TPA: hypothetical protein VJ754_07250 [Anaerolineae bacterium]|nr:hypothetical protein [Anaerolineae bacterium]